MKISNRALFFKLFLATFLFASGAVAQSKMGANGGGGGTLRLGKQPTLEELRAELSIGSSIRLLGYLYAHFIGAKNPIVSAQATFMAQKISSGLKIEWRTSSPCLNEAGEAKVASIYSPVADLCFNPKMFLDQKEISLSRYNFQMHLEALFLHEILHLAQQAEHRKISAEDEINAEEWQDSYLESMERNRVTYNELNNLAMSANETLRMKNPFKVLGENPEEQKALCAHAFNYFQFAEAMVLTSTGIVVNYVHLVGMDSDYWSRGTSSWRAAFKSEKEWDLITLRPRGKAYERTPSFIQIAQKMKRYHCENSEDFSNYAEQTFRSKEEMYNEYRDIMVQQVSLIAHKTAEVMRARFQLIPN